MARVLGACALCAIASAEAENVSPVQKVVEMLNGMLQKGTAEKHNEQVQFATYKQFCEDTQAEKKRAVDTAAEKIERLNADIQMAQTSAEETARQVEQLDADTATWTADKKAATAIREQERKEYLAAHKDYSETIDAVERATQMLQAKDINRAQAATPAPAADAPAATSLLATLLQSKGLNKDPEAKKVLTAFLMNGMDNADPPEAYAYESRSGGIIDLLKKLKDKFVDQRTALEKEEMNKKHAYQMLSQDLTSSIKNAEAARSTKVQLKASSLQNEATMKGELADTMSTKADDDKYLTDTTTTCKQKAADFEERQQLRADEITALQKAIEILSSDAVSGSSEKHLEMLVQVHKRGVALVQSTKSEQNPNQERLADYLASQAEKINSRFLSALAVRVRDDPFSKVKKMIKDLIVRLMEQATEESQHKGWCDTELAENEQVRTSRSSLVERYHTEIDQRTSKIATLASEVTALSQEVATLDENVATMTATRNKEKATNEATMADARAAQDALSRAEAILMEFYNRAGDATALVQKKKQDPAAPEIFDGAYKGMQDKHDGVIGMLQVIQSDYARLLSDTDAMETTAASDYDRSMSDSAVLKAQQQKDIEHKTRERQTNEQALADLKNDLSSAQKELDAAMNYYDKLKPSCLDAGTTYEERNQRRQEEIQSLQEAMRILNGEDIATTF